MRKTVTSDQWPVIGKTRRGALALTGCCLLLTGYCFAFDLPKGAVYPRIFSPNGDGINDVVFFDVVNPSLDSLEGRIYDKDGSQVADARFDSFPGGQVERWVWDGKDRNGNAVRAGVYIYEVKSGNQSVTGSVVVAK